ncbi:TRAP transporter large permease [Salipiger sp. PrR002]|uniref:TRAP transporter large permease n=1 Tax=Salipiger sp. PrR002 TaxID=2706489 RepID=UPI0013B61910|nr:TRAP transporter large permease [Salipiger sp. PrR002]NDW01987.1 TRAP transporter large permease [Salipiger sp. PrR002]NDW59027.1 TRAP transporter large permease [Salipiger sp. PrR004]
MIDTTTLAALYIALLVGLSLLGFHVAAVMAMLGVIGALLTFGPAVVMNIGGLAWSTSNDYLLVALPMFVLMGELLLRSGITDRLYNALSAWVRGVPGGLLHSNIFASAIFSATSGSSVATAATIGSVAMPNMTERGYNERLALGSIAAGGTLGILIPPSINLMIYGAITNTSVGRLFAAGVVPGVLMTLLFSAVIVIWTRFDRASAGRGGTPAPMRERLALLVDLLPILLIFAVVMGSLYSGFATATEAAALGTVAATGLAAARGRLNRAMLAEAFRSTIKVTGMVTLLIVAAFFLNFVLGLIGIPQAVAQWVDTVSTGPLMTLLLLICLYLVLGCFMETLSMLITTLPIVTPIVLQQGIDPVWFGIFVVIMCELSLVTPPVGMNLFVVQGIRKPGSDVRDVVLGAIPFVLCMLVLVGLLIAAPVLATWLPDMLYG